ncbi:MAG: NADH-quinone oxidoreductase subunit L [Anaerolineales bacterium]|nr:NADH-quinone oxidoreductase subunit L [Anaerolineales bacterium]
MFLEAQTNILFELAPWIIAFPLIGMIVNLVFGQRLGERFTGAVASSAVGLAFIVAILQFVALQADPHGAHIRVGAWIAIGQLDASWTVRIDTLSATMMLMVTGVSTLIHIYAIGYMHEDVRLQGDPGRFTRFFVFFNLFVAAMMVLVSADNYLMMFVGWEGVGLCSYLLIGFWYDKGEGGIANAVAGKKAFIANRVGDFGFLVAMFLMFTGAGSLQFDQAFAWAAGAGPEQAGLITAIALFLLLGATGKSAQIPLYVWLPDAMAGPTPVSALIHAATMVTAGIYMIARSAVLFGATAGASQVVALIGAATALFAATIAVGQFDIKKVLAYSTISQLGFMLAAVGISAQVAGMFHLVTHAFFKALLFLSAGSVILGVEHGLHHQGGDHAGFNPNDMRAMGGLRSRMKVTFAVYLTGALALAGIPPLAGFFSKDEILAEASHLYPLVYILLTLAAFLTAFYMGRQIFMVFFGKPRSSAAEHAHENPPLITLPLIGLAILAAVGGGLNLPGLHSLAGWLEHTLGHSHILEFNYLVAGISTALALFAIGLAWLLYGRKPMKQGEEDPLKRILGPVFSGIANKWWIDELYGAVFIRPYAALSTWLAEVVDWKFWHDWFHDSVIAKGFRGLTAWLSMDVDLKVIDAIADGIARLTGSLSERMSALQTGYVRSYALSMFVGMVLLLSYILFV